MLGIDVDGNRFIDVVVDFVKGNRGDTTSSASEMQVRERYSDIMTSHPPDIPSLNATIHDPSTRFKVRIHRLID